MIYLEQTSGWQQVRIPRAMDFDGVSLVTLYLSHIPSQEDYTAQIREWSIEGAYYTLVLALPEGIPTGEYDYFLDGERGEAISKGILQVSAVQQGRIVPDSGIETITYKTYEE